ncbi:MAG: IPTL-CTERM sorting domain-containing protein [Pseudomonadota bacterium]|nr:IPTL-CTERM sorting domain-containing protein [Pseudomonadota bacterium]
MTFFLVRLSAAALLALGLCGAARAQATTYAFTGPPYDAGDPAVSAPYAGGMRVTGWFTTSAPLAANLPLGTDVAAQVIAWSFSDGVQTFEHTSSMLWPPSPPPRWQVSTDAAGNVTDAQFQLLRPGTPPAHAVDDRMGMLMLLWGSNVNPVYNASCAVVSAGVCDWTDPAAPGAIAFVTRAAYENRWRTRTTDSGVAAVPTLSQWGLMLTALLAAVLGTRRLRHRS